MLQLKICGLKDPRNIKEMVSLEPNMLGFIFHERSPRNFPADSVPPEIPATIEKVGVFVDSDPGYIDFIVRTFRLNAIQLYHEDLKPFQKLRTKVKLIKAISVGCANDIYKTRNYMQDCDRFLFDAKGKNAGGNGSKFDWDLLKAYSGCIPFFLSGGIGATDANALKDLHHDKLIGIDINSRFEIEPGLKNTETIKQFKNKLYENIEHHR